MDKYDSGAVDDNGLLLINSVEGGIFFYFPHPEDLQNGLAPGYFACVILNTELERVRFSPTI